MGEVSVRTLLTSRQQGSTLLSMSQLDRAVRPSVPEALARGGRSVPSPGEPHEPQDASALRSGKPGRVRHVTVAIVGTGFSGLCMAIKLKEAGIHDFVLFE